MDIFVSDIQANPLAVIVLVALIMSGITSLVLMFQTTPIPVAKSWYAGLLVIFTLLGLPAILDLLQTSGVTFILAALILGIFVLNIIILLLNLTQKSTYTLVANWDTWSIPVLVGCGFIVAGYLTFGEVTETLPACGITISGCHIVIAQANPYAYLFGVLPVGILGLTGYVAILAAWLMRQWGPAPLKKASCLALWGMCFFGVLFSTYLTYLEAFVIRATCVWCVTSAVLMILLLWVSTPAAQAVFVGRNDDKASSG